MPLSASSFPTTAQIKNKIYICKPEEKHCTMCWHYHRINIKHSSCDFQTANYNPTTLCKFFSRVFMPIIWINKNNLLKQKYIVRRKCQKRISAETSECKHVFCSRPYVHKTYKKLHNDSLSHFQQISLSKTGNWYFLYL